jgi:hypothetical protein
MLDKLIAMVEFLDSARGGRTTEPKSGFRPQLDMGGIHTSCTVESETGASTFNFGVQHRVSLQLMHAAHFAQSLPVGSPVRLYEGSKLIGQGQIV